MKESELNSKESRHKIMFKQLVNSKKVVSLYCLVFVVSMIFVPLLSDKQGKLEQYSALATRTSFSFRIDLLLLIGADPLPADSIDEFYGTAIYYGILSRNEPLMHKLLSKVSPQKRELTCQYAKSENVFTIEYTAKHRAFSEKVCNMINEIK
jgi:hypothetical protein